MTFSAGQALEPIGKKLNRHCGMMALNVPFHRHMHALANEVKQNSLWNSCSCACNMHAFQTLKTQQVLSTVPCMCTPVLSELDKLCKAAASNLVLPCILLPPDLAWRDRAASCLDGLPHQLLLRHLRHSWHACTYPWSVLSNDIWGEESPPLLQQVF